MTDIRQVADVYFAAWAACDPDAIVALHAPDTQFWLHLGSEPAKGREAVRQAFADVFAQFPQFGFETYRTFFGADHWVLDWALTAVLPGDGDGGRPVRFDCVDVVTVDGDGLVQRKDTFVDMVQLNAALGA